MYTVRYIIFFFWEKNIRSFLRGTIEIHLFGDLVLFLFLEVGIGFKIRVRLKEMQGLNPEVTGKFPQLVVF